MSASPKYFYTGGRYRAITYANRIYEVFLIFAGCERAQNAVEFKRAFGVERGLAQ